MEDPKLYLHCHARRGFDPCSVAAEIIEGVVSGVRFPPPETEDVARVLAGTARRVLRVVESRALDLSDETFTSDEPLLALLTAASIRSRIATGPEAGERWRRLGDRVEPMDREEVASSRTPESLLDVCERAASVCTWAWRSPSTIGADLNVCVVMWRDRRSFWIVSNGVQLIGLTKLYHSVQIDIPPTGSTRLR